MKGRGNVIWRARYVLIGGIALVIAGSLIGWHFWDSRGDVLKPDAGLVVTVMNFSRSFPLDRLPSGWTFPRQEGGFRRCETLVDGAL
jgi:hypothetical protein